MLAGVTGWPHTKSWWATTATPGSRWRTAPQTWWVTTVTFKKKPSFSRRYSKGGNYYHSANLLSSSVIMCSLCKLALCSVSFLLCLWSTATIWKHEFFLESNYGGRFRSLFISKLNELRGSCKYWRSSSRWEPNRCSLSKCCFFATQTLCVCDRSRQKY